MTQPAQLAHKRFHSLSWKHVFSSKWFIPLICVFVLVALLSLRLIANADIGFHLRGGQWMWEHKAFHARDVFTYTVNQHEYIAMYWLYQIILYAAFVITGYVGISVCNSVLTAGLFVLLFLRLKTDGVPLGISTIVLAISVCAMEIRFSVRPEIITWFFIAGELWLLDRCYHKGKKLLFLLPVIQVLWTNGHGLFVLGWIIIGAYFVSSIIRRRSFDRTFAVWFVVAILVSFINPYFLKGFLYPFQLFDTLQPAGPFKSVIAEFASPWTVHVSQANPFIPIVPLYMYYTLAIASCVLVIATFKRRSPHEFVLVAVFLYISSMAMRNIPLFVIVAVHINAISLRDVVNVAWEKWNLKKRAKPFTSYTAGAFTLVVLMLCLRIISNAYYISDRRQSKFGLGLDQDAHPVGASEYIVSNNLDGRVLNDLNTGSWLIWSIPQPIFIDGRLEVMGAEFFGEAIGSFTDHGLQRLVNKFQPALIVFDHTQTYQWITQLRGMTDWRLIYLDEISAIYAWKDYMPHIAERGVSDIIADMDIARGVHAADGWSILKTSKISGLAIWLEEFSKGQEYPRKYLDLGRFAYLSGSFRDAELLYLTFLKETGARYFEVFANLGLLYYQTGEYEKARYCYEQLPRWHVDAVLSNGR